METITLTDKIIFFSAIFFFWRGWSKGLIQTILGPVALIIGTLISYIYYLIYHNIIIATAIGIILPIILSIIFSMTLGVVFLGKDKKNISHLSRLCGGLINTVWGEFLILTGLFLIILIPLRVALVETAQLDIKQSNTYFHLSSFVKKNFNVDISNNLDPSQMKALTDPKALETLSETKEFQDVLQDPIVQALLNDPEANKAIESKDIGKLVQNPKFIAITKDPALLKKFLSLYGTILDADKAGKPAAMGKTEAPKNH